ncbi:BTB/POZ protein [Rhizophagus irregularis DAOM 181602=DAOM 197198]|nr:BTB/POZ protein [Rhizophagus irregularis DAOM 181602=DAOM 197198]
MVVKNLLPRLSQDFLKILNDEEYYDITIEVEIFQIILSYLYGGKLSLDEYDTSDVMKILDAASELNLQEEFVDKVLPYEKVFPKDIYRDLIKSFLNLLNPDSRPNGSSDRPRPCNIRESEKIVGSRIITQQHNNAIKNHFYYGPSFGENDLVIWSSSFGNYCKRSSYLKPIRQTKNKFDVEECEVFQIIHNEPIDSNN